LLKRGIAFEELDNGFLSCEDPEALQEICDQLGPEQIQAFFNKWQARLQVFAAIDTSQPVPLPLAVALEQVEQAVAELVNHAHLAPSAA